MSAKYAVINAFGRQYRVSEGDQLTVDFIEGDAGKSIDINNILLLGNGSEVKVGAPTVAGAKVTATLEKQTRGDKVLVFKYLRKNKLKKLAGHRQPYSVIKIKSIQG